MRWVGKRRSDRAVKELDEVADRLMVACHLDRRQRRVPLDKEAQSG